MNAPASSFPRSGCRRCLDDAWLECGACSRWYCGPCSRARNGGHTACVHCHPAPRGATEGGEP